MITLLHDPESAELHCGQGRAINFPLRVGNRGEPQTGVTCEGEDDLVKFVLENHRSTLSAEDIESYVRCFCLPLDVLDAKGRAGDGACFESVYLLGGR